MKRILFFLLCAFFVLAVPEVQALEIYAHGNRYDSLQAYLASKKIITVAAPAIPVALNSRQQDYIRKEAKQLGLDVDFSKVRAFQMKQIKLPNAIQHKLYVMSVENGVIGALQDFYEARGQTDLLMAHAISSEQLQEAIAQAVARSEDPKLLISGQGKVRIMDLAPGK